MCVFVCVCVCVCMCVCVFAYIFGSGYFLCWSTRLNSLIHSISHIRQWLLSAVEEFIIIFRVGLMALNTFFLLIVERSHQLCHSSQHFSISLKLNWTILGLVQSSRYSRSGCNVKEVDLSNWGIALADRDVYEISPLQCYSDTGQFWKNKV